MSRTNSGATQHGDPAVPIAIVGMACRLPGHVHNPKDLWDLMIAGGVAENTPPESRFSLAGHYDGSRKPYTMKTPGAMFMEDVDPALFDAGFFNINFTDASSMDPQQRNLMEVAYECLESAGIPIEKLSGRRVGCLVGANTVDYYDMTCRDPEDRTDSPTMGSNRALLSNRISHFLNVHGPSISLDTACSSTLIALDMACLYLQSGQVDAMLVGGANMYLSPERNQDMGSMRPTASPSGRCHTFDSKADGYVAAEAINAVFLKRLDDAIRDRDPIRAVIRGTSTNSAGRTPGIAMPNAKAQAAAIRAAYARAGISESEFSDTGFLECHGTGTLVGDPIEVEGAAMVFAATRPVDKPLVIGSIKSNIGHSEGAAGLSGVLKAVLAMEKGVIPGTATFITPNPKIDFAGCRVKAYNRSVKWPRHSKRRTSINSFGFGGANAHAIIESPEYLLGTTGEGSFKSSYISSDSVDASFFDEDEISDSLNISKMLKPMLLPISANDEKSLKSYITALSDHLINPGVKVSLPDLAYTLSERRSRLYHRAYSVQRDAQVFPDTFVMGKRAGQDGEPRIGFVFTGQGAQWPKMGKDLLETFPKARKLVDRLDATLATLPEPVRPTWSLVAELSQERKASSLRQPEFSQPLVTALQLAYLDILSDWGVEPAAVVGHSSGEIAAAVAAGLLTPEEAIKIAYFRGQAVKQSQPSINQEFGLGMLAAGIGADQVREFIDPTDDHVDIACFNSPRSLTLSGTVNALERLKERLSKAKFFVRMLQVDFAYHSTYMNDASKIYREMLEAHCHWTPRPGNGKIMFSSVTGEVMKGPADADYWTNNMLGQVRFAQAASAMVEAENGAPFLIEIGPSNALFGPISQIFETARSNTSDASMTYVSAAQRGPDTLLSLYDVAGKIFGAGGSVDLSRVNSYESLDEPPACIIDLPNYVWNHSNRYWHESLASKDWRYRPFVRHDLLGSKVLGSSWRSPIWRNRINWLEDHPWLKDHKLGEQVVFPGAGYVSMAIEALYQASFMTTWNGEVPSKYRYVLRDMKFFRALVLEEGEKTMVMLSLNAVHESTSPWYGFKVFSVKDDIWTDHASGFIRIETDFIEVEGSDGDISPLKTPTDAKEWYKCMRISGFNFGQAFQKHIAMEYVAGERRGRSTVSLEPPPSAWPQSQYPIHPACLDGCFQTVTSSVWKGDKSDVNAALVPFQIDRLFIMAGCDTNELPSTGVSVAHSDYVGVGRRDLAKNYSSSCKVFDPESRKLLLHMEGLRYTELDSAQETTLAHNYMQLTWNADITLLAEDGLHSLAAEVMASSDDSVQATSSIAHRLIDLSAHKKPGLKILEVNLDQDDATCLWLQHSHVDNGVRGAFEFYQFVSATADCVVAAQEVYANASRNLNFTMADLSKADVMLDGRFDLVILKMAPTQCNPPLDVLKNVQRLLDDNGLGLLLVVGSLDAPINKGTTPEDAGFFWVGHAGSVTLARVEKLLVKNGITDGAMISDQTTNGTPTNGALTNGALTNGALTNDILTDGTLTNGTLANGTVTNRALTNGNLTNGTLINGTLANGALTNGVLTNDAAERGLLADNPDPSGVLPHEGAIQHKEIVDNAVTQPNGALNKDDVVVVHFGGNNSSEQDSILSEMTSFSFSKAFDASAVRHGCRILVLDELINPITTTFTELQWQLLHSLIEKQCKILWVTSGAQGTVRSPDKAAIIGLFRVIRNEEPLLRLINLDVEHPSGGATIQAIKTCLNMLDDERVTATSTRDDEFMERGGIISISRVLSDKQVNQAKEEVLVSSRPVENMDFRGCSSTFRLHAERIGNIDALHYNEVIPQHEISEGVLEENYVEIEVYASGVNFKEVAVTVGIIPENELLLGGEGSGIVRRVANDVTAFRPGQRVAFFEKGSFGNRIVTKTEAVHAIPDTMTFEEAATIPCVFMTSMYSLYRLANIKKGDRVLIHSATGGVGISAIQLSQHVGAEVFATVGTQEKRDFLKSTFGIPDERIFSSRSTAFGAQILKLTNGEGVNVILNSLTGELLDESWRIIAAGGVMVEIGKRDILDKNTLSMEPFNRNASFRALDLSHKEISDEMIASLLSDIFQLMAQGQLKPIWPRHVFSFTDIPAAFRLLRSGKHIGKLVISDANKTKITVPVRRLPREMRLRSDVCYFIVGGLKGLCSSLAIHMAKNGAKHLAVLSRSGHSDEASHKAAKDIRALGCDIDLLTGDVTIIEDVRRAFNSTAVPIGGIVQGAMVLRDRVYGSMTVDEYHTALACKVRGTWNLHNAALEQGLALDSFTMLSSISGLYGSKGQANYAAGNAFLDAFAVYRRQLGLPACSVDLGVIEDVGYMAERVEMKERYDYTVWQPINERLLRKILGLSIMQQQKNPINSKSAAHMITGIQLPQPSDSLLLRDARFSGLRVWGEEGGQNTSGSGKSITKDVQAILVMIRSKAEPKAVLDLTVEMMNAYLVRSLRLTEAMDYNRPLSTYGIDSLAAVEFRNFVRVELAVELTTLEVINATSLLSICGKIIARIPVST